MKTLKTLIHGLMMAAFLGGAALSFAQNTAAPSNGGAITPSTSSSSPSATPRKVHKKHAHRKHKRHSAQTAS